MMGIIIFLLIIIIFILFTTILIIFYGYHSGSCKIRKKYPCHKNFCLYKLIKIKLPTYINKKITELIKNKKIQKRVNMSTKPENIGLCAMPNKRGVTISTQAVNKYFPELINFYQNKLCQMISKKISLKLHPTSLGLPTSCVLLIYEKEGDWINWHYDYNYYQGRFFTVLIPITKKKTCTQFQFMNDKNQIKSIDLIDNIAICFEGNYLYHRASKLCKNEKRVILSCQFVTDNSMSFINSLRLKIKDFAYIGKLF